ncbi:DUF86 domain-containing protein [Candidatus Uhrbacteria bacterium]|nr:DUF86 domain-containing protein [Candidatus Uhrbacteria bacterium]
MMKNVKVYLDDILDSIAKIEYYTKNSSREEFFKDELRQDAVIRRLAVIGEAVKGLPTELKKKFTDVPWRDIAGMRDFVVHEYSAVDLLKVWPVIETDLPDLREKIKKIYSSL